MSRKGYICVCNAVRVAEVRKAIKGGAHTRPAVTKVCGAGGDCGGCHTTIEDMIEETLEQKTGDKS